MELVYIYGALSLFANILNRAGSTTTFGNSILNGIKILPYIKTSSSLMSIPIMS